MNTTMKFISETLYSAASSLSSLHWSDTSILLTASLTAIAIIFTILHRLFIRIERSAIRVPELEQNHQTRFRKRDRVRFFAQKVLRKGKNAASQLQQRASAIKQGVAIPEYSRSGRRLRKRERMLILAKRMFQVKQEPPKLLKKEMPSSVLEADLMEGQKPNLPEEVMYLLQSVKVFGHFEKGIFLQLCRHMEILKIEREKYLFQIGDPDEYMYVIQDGQINLYISEDEREFKLSEFTAGESLHSLFSILDVLTGHPAPYKTVYARAVEDSTVIRLPVEAFNIAFKTRQDALVQMVQVIMTRMQRVTFLALHNYLGLSHELLKAGRSKDGSNLSVNKLLHSKDSLLGTSFLEMHTSVEDHDETDSPILLEKKEEVKDILTRVQTCPILTPEKIKKLRFGDVETAENDEDVEEVKRQASIPASHEKCEESVETLEASDKRSEDDLEQSIPRQRSASTSSRRRHVSQESVGAKEAHSITTLNEPEILDLALQDMSQLFGITDMEILRNKVILLSVPQGWQVIQEGDQDVSLYFVVYGALKIYQAMQHPSLSDEWQNVTLFNIYPGMLTGQMAVLTGEPSFFSVSALKHSVIAKFPRKDYYNVMRHYPHMVLNTAHTVVQRVSGFTRQIDFALDWTMVEAGKALYRQNSSSDCMYIVLHGRLRSVYERNDGKKELVSEYGRGEIVGMMEALRGATRSAAMLAVRDTELAKIPEGLLKHIRRRHPGVVSHLVSLMSDKLIGNIMSSRLPSRSHPGEILSHKRQMAEETKIAYGDVSNHLANLSTVAVLPIDQHVPIDKFTIELEHALSAICDNVLHLNSDAIKRRLGQSALDSAHEYRLMGWLDQQEDLHRIVLYQTDYQMSAWTQRCIRQSDAILVVGNGDSEPEVGELERELESISVRSLKVLVLLHRPDVARPSRTVEWLNMRGWLTEHLHIKGSKRLFARTRKSKLPEYREKLSRRDVDAFSDFSRLARFLTGTSIALVLGGGGARGISQVGVIKALLEAGIPIDLIGGTSIGAFVGGAWACSRDLSLVRTQAAYISSEIGAITPKLFDLTYPITSMFSGASFNKGIHDVFKEIQIEDLWIPYYAITTDVTSCRMRVHTDGLVWKYVRASMSFTPYLPPLCDPRDGHYLVDGCYVNNVPGTLWRYVRASMSLSGYLPPICDPTDGHLLMDGGYINNLPGDVARSRGARRVIAVDVGASSDTDFTNYGDQLSGWWLLWKRWTGRWTGHIKVPDMNEIQSRLSYISCYYLLDLVTNSDYCTYLRPPIMQYRTMDFGKWTEILEVGYEYGRSVCTEEWAGQFWRELFEVGTDQRRMSGHSEELTALRKKLSVANMRANLTFTDLSEVLRKKSPEEAFLLATDFSDYELGYESSPEALSGLSTVALSEPDGATSDLEVRTKCHFDAGATDTDSTSDDDDPEEGSSTLIRSFSSQNILSSYFK